MGLGSVGLPVRILSSITEQIDAYENVLWEECCSRSFESTERKKAGVVPLPGLAVLTRHTAK